MLKRHDKDGDGVLSGTEREEARATAGTRGGGRIRERMMRRFDADGDGVLNEEERAAAEKAREEFRSNRPSA
jgi:Ca2+-binding EF-hand superfamily protein